MILLVCSCFNASHDAISNTDYISIIVTLLAIIVTVALAYSIIINTLAVKRIAKETATKIAIEKTIEVVRQYSSISNAIAYQQTVTILLKSIPLNKNAIINSFKNLIISYLLAEGDNNNQEDRILKSQLRLIKKFIDDFEHEHNDMYKKAEKHIIDSYTKTKITTKQNP